MEFNLDEFIKNQGEINNQLVTSNSNMFNAIKKIKNDGIEALSKELGELKGNYKKIKNDMDLIKKGNEEIKLELKVTKEELNVIKDKTDVIEFDDSSKLGELKRTAKTRVMMFTGDRTNPKYILFFRPYISNLYSNVTKNLNGGKRLGKIKTEDFDVALKLVKRWCPTNKYTEKLTNDYLKSKTLSEEKKKALEIYLDEINGR